MGLTVKATAKLYIIIYYLIRFYFNERQSDAGGPRVHFNVRSKLCPFIHDAMSRQITSENEFAG